MVLTNNLQNPRPQVRGTYAVINQPGTGPELKSLDISGIPGVPLWTSGGAAVAAVMAPVPCGLDTQCFFATLNLIGQGTDLNQRIGRTILLKSLLLRFQLQVPPSWLVETSVIPGGAGPPPVTNNLSVPVPPPFPVRCLLVWDTQPNGNVLTAAGINNILQPLPTGEFWDSGFLNHAAGNYTTPFSSMNLSNRQRFLTLWDREYHLSSQVPNQFVEQYLPLKDRLTLFQDNLPVATNASITHGALYFIAMSDRSVPATTSSLTAAINAPCILFQSRLRFIDP